MLCIILFVYLYIFINRAIKKIEEDVKLRLIMDQSEQVSLNSLFKTAKLIENGTIDEVHHWFNMKMQAFDNAAEAMCYFKVRFYKKNVNLMSSSKNQINIAF